MRRPTRLVAALLLPLLVACSSDDESWQTSPASSDALVTDIVAVGSLEPLDEVDVGSDQSGILATVEVEQNASVTTGQVLARLDPTSFQLEVDQAAAALASAEATALQRRVEAEEAERQRARAERLLARGAASAVEVEEAIAAEESAEAVLAQALAQVRQAKATLNTAQDDLDDTVITSPIDGVVLQRSVEPGQTVVSSLSATTLFTIASDLASMKADVQVDEADVGQIAAGQTATFVVSAWPERTFDAEVYEVDLAPDPDEDVVVYLAELRLDNEEGLLRPGMTVTASIETGRSEGALLVAAEALRVQGPGPAPSGDHVWVLDGEHPVPVRVTIVGTDGSNAAVTPVDADSPLVDGAEVITGGGPTKKRSAGFRVAGPPGGGRR